MAKRREKPIDVIAYLSTDGNMYSAPGKEKKQLRYIKEYAKAHKINIVRTMNRDIVGNWEVLKHFKTMANMIANGYADGVIVVNTEAISVSMADAYYKVGMIAEVGGTFISVDEGRLALRREA